MKKVFMQVFHPHLATQRKSLIRISHTKSCSCSDSSNSLLKN